MESEDKQYLIKLVSMVAVIMVLVLGPVIAWRWYTSGLQQKIYLRQQIHMTQWEIFIGLEPAQRTIRIEGN